MIVFLSDRILKILVFENFSLGVSYPVLKDMFHITPVHNRGIAFGLFGNLDNIIFVCIAFFVLALMFYFVIIKRPESILLLSGIFLVFSGAASNLTDRILYGYVMDFIDLRIWPVFNIADSAITIGAFLILLYLFKQKSKTCN
ncbi:signal peptidase II [bacterium]|nr:MAG: signal peptidase II [bacterium]